MWTSRTRTTLGYPQRSNARELVVLARRDSADGKRFLLWRMAGGRYDPGGYSPPSLILRHDYTDRVIFIGEWKGERLSKALLARHAADINEFFGEAIADRVHPQKTLEWTDQPSG